MPAEYPFKPPAFVMLTPSGRFATDTKICLSISSFHPESWQPSWSVRSALIALIAFMQSSGDGAIGSIEVSSEIRRQMAAEARVTPPKHSNVERHELIRRMHEKMLDMEARSRAIHKTDALKPDASGSQPNDQIEEPAIDPNKSEGANQIAEDDRVKAMDGSVTKASNNGDSAEVPAPALASAPEGHIPQVSPTLSLRPPQQRDTAGENRSWEDRGLAYLAIVLLLLLVAVVARRIFLAFNKQTQFASHSFSATGIHFRDVGDL